MCVLVKVGTGHRGCTRGSGCSRCAVGELVWLWWFGIWVLRFVQPQRHDQHLGGGQRFVLGPGLELGTGFCQWLNGGQG